MTDKSGQKPQAGLNKAPSSGSIAQQPANLTQPSTLQQDTQNVGQTSLPQTRGKSHSQFQGASGPEGQNRPGNQEKNAREQEKRALSAMETAELNEYIKSYLKFNKFTNSLECFEAEINAKRMSSKLDDKKIQKDDHIIEQIPKLYQMLKGEEAHIQRERKMENNMKIFNQKYLEMLNASRSLFSISVKLLQDYITISPQITSEKIDGYKKSIGQFRRLVLEEGKPSEKQPPNNEQIIQLKNNIIQLSQKAHNPIPAEEDKEANIKKQLKEDLIKLRLISLETGQTYRLMYLQNLIKLDILDLEHLHDENHYILTSFNNFDHFVKHQLVALISIVCSSYSGRRYLLEKDSQFLLLHKIILIMKSQEKGSVSQRFCLAVLQKLSLHDETMNVLAGEKVHEWLLELLKAGKETDQKVHVFALEFASAILANMLSEDHIIKAFSVKQDIATLFLGKLLNCLSSSYSLETNKQILRCLSLFTKSIFNQSLLETSYDEKINKFLDEVSQNTTEDYKTQLLTYHAKLFTKELHKQDFEMEQLDDFQAGMKKKYDGEDDSFDEGYDDPDGLIIFEHFNDELSDEILNKSYKN